MDPDTTVPDPGDASAPSSVDRAREHPPRGAGGRARPGRRVPREEPSDPAPRLELEGVVEEGVELGAVVLRVQDGRTWLVGAAQRHLVGHRVRVRGAERRGVLTTAQQGPPLAVEDVVDLGPA